MAVLEAYSDESGGQDSYLTVASYVGYSDNWRSFHKRWQKLLKKKDLKAFHMKEFMSPESMLRKALGKENEAAAFYSNLTGLIHEYTCTSFAFVIWEADYERYTTADFRSRYGTAYTFLNKEIVRYCRSWAKYMGYKKLINFQVESGYVNCDQLILELLRQNQEGLIGRASAEKKERSSPLQAADILAYLTSNGYDNDFRPPAARLPRVRRHFFDRTEIKQRVKQIEDAWRAKTKPFNDAARDARRRKQEQRSTSLRSS